MKEQKGVAEQPVEKQFLCGTPFIEAAASTGTPQTEETYEARLYRFLNKFRRELETGISIDADEVAKATRRTIRRCVALLCGLLSLLLIVLVVNTYQNYTATQKQVAQRNLQEAALKEQADALAKVAGYYNFGAMEGDLEGTPRASGYAKYSIQDRMDILAASVGYSSLGTYVQHLTGLNDIQQVQIVESPPTRRVVTR